MPFSRPARPIHSLYLMPILILVLGSAPVQARAIFASPTGSAAGPGRVDAPYSLSAGLAALAAGDTLWLQGGTYVLREQLTIAAARDGASDRPIRLFAAPGARPVLDFSSQTYAASGNPRGLELDGDWWHVRGLEVKGSADVGIYVGGSHITVENCVAHGNRDSGIQIGRSAGDVAQSDWPAYNLILNCESYDNYDLPPGSGENADGFACKLTSGPGNVFRGCASHHNIDDGWDLYTKSETGPIGPVVLDQCIAYANGTLTDGTSNAQGDRNGFKLGGEKIAVAHTVSRCVAFGNGKNGFTWNSNPGAIRMLNNLAFDNTEGNFNFGTNSVPTQAVFANNLSFWTLAKAATATDKTLGTDFAGSNCWWDKSKAQPSVNAKGMIVAASDFAKPLAGLRVMRDPATGAPDLSVFRLAAGSGLRDAGAMPEGTLPFDAARYYVKAPDLGAVEGEGTPTALRRRNAAAANAIGTNPGRWSAGARDARGRLSVQGVRMR